MILIHAAAPELDPLARFELIPQQLPEYVLRQVRGPSRAQGLKQLGFSRFGVVNGDPAQFGSGQTGGVDDVTQFVYPRAEPAHIVFEAQFAGNPSVRVESTCAAGWVDGATRRSTTRVSIPCWASSSAAVAPAGPAPTIRTRNVVMSLPGCAEFRVHHAGHSVSRDP